MALFVLTGRLVDGSIEAHGIGVQAFHGLCNDANWMDEAVHWQGGTDGVYQGWEACERSERSFSIASTEAYRESQTHGRRPVL